MESLDIRLGKGGVNFDLPYYKTLYIDVLHFLKSLQGFLEKP